MHSLGRDGPAGEDNDDDNDGGAAAGHAGVVDEAGSDDPEHARTRSVPRLQRRLAAVVDAQLAEHLTAAAEADGREHDVRRVRDLRDETVSHEWLWSLAPTSRHTLEPDVYVDAVRLRLGAARGPPATRCRVCGR